MEVRAFATQRGESSRLHANEGSLHTFREQSRSSKLKRQRRVLRMRLWYLSALQRALHQNATTLCRSKQILQEVRRKEVKLGCKLMRQDQFMGLARRHSRKRQAPWSHKFLRSTFISKINLSSPDIFFSTPTARLLPSQTTHVLALKSPLISWFRTAVKFTVELTFTSSSPHRLQSSAFPSTYLFSYHLFMHDHVCAPPATLLMIMILAMLRNPERRQHWYYSIFIRHLNDGWNQKSEIWKLMLLRFRLKTAKQLPAADTVKNGFNARSNSSRGKFIKWLIYNTRI